jgi:hypothetical protein
MTEPEKTEDKFAALAQEFNKSAKGIAAGEGLSMDGLMAKFDILWRFKAENSTDHARLVEGLYEGGMDIVRKLAKPSCHENIQGHMNNFQQIFTFLMKPEYMQFLPDNASTQLVDGALDLIRKSEGVRYEYNWQDYAQHKEGLIAFAKSVATFAEKTREPKQGVATFAASKTIAPAKRLTMTEPGN